MGNCFGSKKKQNQENVVLTTNDGAANYVKQDVKFDSIMAHSRYIPGASAPITDVRQEDTVSWVDTSFQGPALQVSSATAPGRKTKRLVGAATQLPRHTIRFHCGDAHGRYCPGASAPTDTSGHENKDRFFIPGASSPR